MCYKILHEEGEVGTLPGKKKGRFSRLKKITYYHKSLVIDPCYKRITMTTQSLVSIPHSVFRVARLDSLIDIYLSIIDRYTSIQLTISIIFGTQDQIVVSYVRTGGKKVQTLREKGVILWTEGTSYIETSQDFMFVIKVLVPWCGDVFVRVIDLKS